MLAAAKIRVRGHFTARHGDGPARRRAQHPGPTVRGWLAELDALIGRFGLAAALAPADAQAE